MVRHLPTRSCLATVLLMGAIGIASGVNGAAAQTATTAPDGSIDVLRALQLKAGPAPAPDFVVRTRPGADKLDFIPVGKHPPDRSDKILSPAEVSALTADLDATREKQQRRAGRKPAKVATGPASARQAGKKTAR